MRSKHTILFSLKVAYSFLLLIILVSCIGCSSNSDNQTTPLMEPTATVNLPVDDGIPLQQIEGRSLLIETGHSADCPAPCWNDLRPGQSTQQDVLGVFQSLFAVEDINSLVYLPPLDELEVNLKDNDLMAIGHTWVEYPESPSAPGNLRTDYRLFAYVDPQTDTLMAFYERHTSGPIFASPYFRVMLNELGSPDYIFATVPPANIAVIFSIIYEQGVFITIYLPLEAEQMCIDQSGRIFQTVFLTEFKDEASTIFHEVALRDIENGRAIDNVFGLSEEDFVSQILNGTDCFDIIMNTIDHG